MDYISKWMCNGDLEAGRRGRSRTSCARVEIVTSCEDLCECEKGKYNPKMRIPCLIKLLVSKTTVVLVWLAFAFSVVTCHFFRNVANDLLFVTGGATRSEVSRYFSDRGRIPVMTLKRGDSIPQLGWPTPKKSIDYEMDVFDLDMAVRIYIYYDSDGNVDFVFTSSS